MHEAAIAGEIKDILLSKLKEYGKRRVTAVKLEFGELTSVVPEALKFALESAAEGTPLAGMRTGVKIIRSKAKCGKCKRTFRVNDLNYICDKCYSTDVSVIAGREMTVKTVEME
ncbi:MAG TPA: hydrogenase maturation nickel metallochaperone HypA [bacterium]|nr:hydrogenase maturation nickel metallochaperone HypA [bacterium]